MRAIRIHKTGGVEQLELTDVEAPRPGRGQVVLRVVSCGVCYRDLVDRQGGYPFMRLPVTTGHEIAGEVVEIGEGVTDLRPGDRVVTTHARACGACERCLAAEGDRCAKPAQFGLTADGGYAERCLADPSSLVRVPDGVQLEEASFLHCTAAVALRALRRHGRLQPGETVLVTGATGGVGVHAVQIAKLLGGRVLAVTGSAHKRDALAALGVDEVIVSAPDGIVQAVKALTGEAGVDVALELVGEPTFQASLRSLRRGGRLIVVGNVTQTKVQVNPGYLIFNEVAVHGSAGATRAELGDVLTWAAEGRLRPVVAERLPLERAREAQTALERRAVFGRQVLLP